MAKIGADPEQLMSLAGKFMLEGSTLRVAGMTIWAELDGVDWSGPDAERFREAWSDYQRVLAKVADAMHEVGVNLIDQAEQQIAASGGQIPWRESSSGGNMAASIPAGPGVAQRAVSLSATNPRGFGQAISGGGPAGALTEWATPAVTAGVFDEGGFRAARSPEEVIAVARVLEGRTDGGLPVPTAPLGSFVPGAVEQATGSDGLSWAGAAGIEGNRGAEGDFSYGWSAEGSTAGEWGGVDWDARGRVMAGVEGDYAASAGITDDRLHAQFDAGVRASAGAMGEIEGNIGFVPYEARGQAMAGGEANVGGSLTAGADGIGADAGADAFLGASADADGSVGWGDYGSVGGSAGASAGVGAHADFSGNVGWDEVSFGADLGATLGIGADVGFDVSFNPAGAVEDLGSWTAEIATDLASIPIDAVGSSIEDAASSLGSSLDDAVGGVVDMAGGAVDAGKSTLSKLNPFG